MHENRFLHYFLVTGDFHLKCLQLSILASAKKPSTDETLMLWICEEEGQPERDGAGKEPHSQYRHSVSLSTVKGGLSKNRRGNESDKQQLSGVFLPSLPGFR